ncbi:MAG: PA2169 family four-helix-bundle protein [Burkholderiales bacterium]|nr:PA2169 family four-helix-bundle protein [Opitutaceae bacterium]
MNTTTHTAEEIRTATAKHLDHLISICKDGEAGYRAATDDTKDLELKSLFTRLARQRGDFAAELQLYVQRLGVEPCDSTSVAGSVHRGWIGLKAVLTKDNSHAVLAECERGEDSAVAAYREVLADAPLESAHRLVVSTQSVAVQAAHDEIRALRDHPAYSGKAA